MSSIEEKESEVIVMDVISPVSSTSTSDSESTSDSQEEPTELFSGLQDDDEEEEEEKDAEGRGKQSSDSVLFMGDLRSSGSASPLEMSEERSSELEYPLCQRVYSNPPCEISTVLQRQCRELWDQFDGIGTEMIVTRRGRLESFIIRTVALLKILFQLDLCIRKCSD